MLPTTAQPSVNTQTMLSEADAFVAKWADFTEDDPRRTEILRRVARIYEALELVLNDAEARPGERVRAAEASLKAVETFARSTRVDMKGAMSGQRLDSWDALLAFVRNFHATYGAAENTLRHADPDGFSSYKTKYADFLATQGVRGAEGPKGTSEDDKENASGGSSPKRRPG